MDLSLSPNGTPWNRFSVFSTIVGCAVMAYAAAAILQIALRPDAGFQVNFKLYYYAAKAMGEGLNPYDARVLRSMAGSFWVWRTG